MIEIEKRRIYLEKIYKLLKDFLEKYGTNGHIMSALCELERAIFDADVIDQEV